MVAQYRTIQVVDEPAPAKAMANGIGEALAARGWVRINEIVGVAGSVYTQQIWMCPTSLSGTSPFYVALAWHPVSQTYLYAGVAEALDGDGSSGKLIRWAGSTATYAITGNGAPAIFNAPTTLMESAAYRVATVSFTNFTYRVVVTNDALWFNVSPSIKMTFLGLFEPFFPEHPNEFPLMAAGLMGTGSSSTDAGGSRRPGETQTTSMSQGLGLKVTFAAGDDHVGVMYGQIGTDAGIALSQKIRGVRPLVSMVTWTTALNTSARGVVKNVWKFYQNTGIKLGDTMTIEGDEFLCVAGSTAYGAWLNLTKG